MSKKPTIPSDREPLSHALARLRDQVLKLRQDVEREQARADAIKAQRRELIAHAK